MQKRFTLTLLSSMAGAKDLNFPFPYGSRAPVPFQASVDPGFVNTTLLKVSLYRPSIDLLDEVAINSGWTEGPPEANMTALAEYWSSHYNWYKVQDEINGNFSHFAITIPGAGNYNHPVRLHFLHERSDASDAIPLLLIHGWPDSHLLWSQVIEPLRSPSNSSTQSFHIVALDMPGFGFSPAATYSGLNNPEMGSAFNQLMNTLGYDRYGIICTDIGWGPGLYMVDRLTENVIGVFSDNWPIAPNATDLERLSKNETTEEETHYIESYNNFVANHTSYADAHTQSPLSIAQAMSDTPVGYAGWVWHLWHWVNDGYELGLEKIITTTMMIWIQGAYGNIRAYKTTEIYDPGERPYCHAPAGVSVWGWFNSPLGPSVGYAGLTPSSWISRIANLSFYSRHEQGGHLPAMTEPELWVTDVRNFFGAL
ncbi:alpha/beta-hydrolase [Xylariaceae sp. FL0255]|nr:alpha/beta-hydrolase [Xylariaceae sp. FL0255]